jgi:hypothetical protein
MMRLLTDPIGSDWTTIHTEAEVTATAAELSARLGRLEVADIDPAWLPLLAAAAAELASIAGIPWRFSTDDPAVALLRLIARATIACPGGSGPHTGRLFAQLPGGA